MNEIKHQHPPLKGFWDKAFLGGKKWLQSSVPDMVIFNYKTFHPQTYFNRTGGGEEGNPKITLIVTYCL